jgi:hypothetical protein
MNITLRKANALQNSIQDSIKNINPPKSIELNEFQDIMSELEKANKAVFDADSKKQKLLLALYNIRGLVGAANASTNINMNLAKCAFIDKRISQLEELAKQDPLISIDVIKGKLEKIKTLKDEARSRIYGYGDTVNTSVITQEQIDQAKSEIKNLKKQKQKLNDETLELNIKTEIPLSEDVVATLQAEGLI